MVIIQTETVRKQTKTVCKQCKYASIYSRLGPSYTRVHGPFSLCRIILILTLPCSSAVAERININGTGIQCHTIRGVVSSDDVLGDDITRGAFALSLTTNSTPVTITEPSIVIFILIEETSKLL